MVEDAERWSQGGSRPRVTRKRRDSIVELAFLRCFLAWERFLEDSFILYLLGKTPPRGRKPTRFALPPDTRTAQELVAGSRKYATWDEPQTMTRAKLYFRGGRPYAGAIEPRQHLLRDARTIRNAIAHDSQSARRRFEELVRSKLGTLPSGTTVGRFLCTDEPGHVPQRAFFELYVHGMKVVAREIVPEPRQR